MASMIDNAASTIYKRLQRKGIKLENPYVVIKEKLNAAIGDDDEVTPSIINQVTEQIISENSSDDSENKDSLQITESTTTEIDNDGNDETDDNQEPTEVNTVDAVDYYYQNIKPQEPEQDSQESSMVPSQGGQLTPQESYELVTNEAERLGFDLTIRQAREISQIVFDSYDASQDKTQFVISAIKAFFDKSEKEFEADLSSDLNGLVDYMNGSTRRRQKMLEEGFGQILKTVTESNEVFKKDIDTKVADFEKFLQDLGTKRS